MGYEKVQGDHLFDGQNLWGREKVLIRDREGGKIDVIDREVAGEDVLFVPGLIAPGFVNAHCHVELSHLKDAVPQHTGLVPFLQQVITKREIGEEQKNKCIAAAIEEMKEDGIIAVGDICNTTDSLELKSQSDLYWQNFIEVLSITDASAPDRLAHYGAVLKAFSGKLAGQSSLSPHASYTVSRTAFEMINDATEGQLISIHNQETPAEDHLYETGESEFLNLYNLFGINSSPFTVTGKSSIRSYLPYFNKGQKIVLVHNTFMPEDDIQWANEYARKVGISLVYCFCVNANLYIENRQPPIEQFLRNDCRIVIGTDSYSSNTELKISHEISSIVSRYPSIPLETILQWATINGAEAFGIGSRWITGSKLLEKLNDQP